MTNHLKLNEKVRILRSGGLPVGSVGIVRAMSGGAGLPIRVSATPDSTKYYYDVNEVERVND